VNSLKAQIQPPLPVISYEEQYAKWIWYLSKRKYNPSLQNLEKLGFNHPDLQLLKDSLKSRGLTNEEIGLYELTGSNLIRMGLSETDLRYLHLDQHDLKRLSLADYYYKLENEQGYFLYHFTLTYKPTEHELKPKNVEHRFIKFYTQHLLQSLMGTRKYHYAKYRSKQPIAFAFLDEHKKDKFTNVGEVARLHHHVILAVHPATKAWFDERIGENTFTAIKQEFGPYLTSDLKPCEPMRILYASKMLETYPDFLSFPDKWKRTHEKPLMSLARKFEAQKMAYNFIKAQVLRKMRSDSKNILLKSIDK
jgi:hypothetical protein